jgi:hypothetical protein
MPSSALLDALDQLRDTYAQRQRLSVNVQTALKGTTGALGKANRVLREYVERNPDGNGAARALDAFAALRLRDEAIDPLMPELRREGKQLAALTSALKEAIAALRAEPVDVVRLGRAHAALRAGKLQDEVLTALLPEIERELDEGQRALGDTFGAALRDALAAQGIVIGGRPPRFEIGRFELAANFVTRSATLSYGKTLVNKRVPLSVQAVVAAYERETKAIMGRNEDGARWIEQFHTAWELVRRKRATSDLRAPIVECYVELALQRQPRSFRSAPLKQGFVDYTRAQFAYDFFEFTNRRPALHQGLRAFGLVATKSQTENPERSIWIVEGDAPHDGRYIADVKFDRDE